MKGAATLATVLALGFARAALAEGRNEGAQPLACVSPEETRELFLANKLVPPVRVMRDAGAGGRDEAIDIELCRFAGGLVYDVTLLSRDGRVFHRLLNATTGAALPGRGTP